MSLEDTQYSVLYIEDDDIDQLAFKRAAKHKQFRFEYAIASTAKEAFVKINERHYDLIIADYLLGDGTAFDIIDQCKNIPIIIVTSLGDEEIAVKAMKAGAYDYVIKDTHGNYLKTIPVLVERSIKIKESELELERYHTSLEKMVEERTQALTNEIEERKRFQKKNDELAGIVEQLAETVIVTNLNGKIEYVNNAYEATTGYDSKDVLGKSAYKFFEYERNIAIIPEIKDAIRTGSVWRGEVHNKKKNGELYTERVCLFTLKDSVNDIHRLVSINHDITNEKNMEAHLRQALKKEAIGTLAGGIAHDFNNILYAMLLNITMVKEATLENANIQKKLNRAQEAGERAKEIIQQILDFSRKTEDTINDVDFVEVLNSSLVIAQTNVSDTIKITTEIASKPLMVKANSSILQQVVLNLLTNAFYSLRDSGGSITIHLENEIIDQEFAKVHAVEVGTYTCLTVSDTGTGIPSSIMDHIFEPFFTTKPINEGTGMGLSVVHGIVSSLNGAITVDSYEGVGTSFRVYIPTFLAV